MIREIEGTRTILKDKNKQKLEDLENDQIELLEMKKQCHENLKLNHRLNTKQTEQIIPDEESISDLKDRSKEVTRMEHGQNTKNHKRSNSIETKESKLNIFP